MDNWKHLCLLISMLLLSAIENSAFLFDDATMPSQCIWYGQCGEGWNNGKLNCPATDATKNPPLLTDPKGLQLLKSLCPDFYVDDTHTHTCCDTAQLQTVANNVEIVQKMILASCPACRKNFMNEICHTVCSVNQSQFMWANNSAPKPPGYTTGLPSVTYVVTDHYAQTMFDSCKDVRLPGTSGKALSLLCGRPAKDCTPHLWLQYMGSTSNGQAPFPINYIYSNTTWVSPDNRTLTALDAKNLACDDPKAACPPADCATAVAPIHPPPTAQTRHEYFVKQFGSDYKAVELKISRKGSQPKVQHNFPPPSIDSMWFTAMYDRQFMHQVLALQAKVSSFFIMTGQGTPISLADVCTKQHGACVTESVLQYWRNNATNLDKTVYDEFNIFLLADYLDHFLSCTKNPSLTVDTTKLIMSCISDFGGPIQPWIVLEGYDSSNYENATSFVITYILNDVADTTAWQTAVMEFSRTYTNPNMTAEFKPINFVNVVQLSDDNTNGGYASEYDPVYEIEDNVDEDVDIGQCVWYGQCGMGWNNAHLNCPATNETRTPPLMKDPKALDILQKFCPEFYRGDDNTRTCCDYSQLKDIEKNFALPQQILQRCPSCYHNFRLQVCMMACSPDQDKFIWANESAPRNPAIPYTTGLPGITYVMSDQFAQQLFDSCKDVQMPSTNDKALSLFCGRKAKDCTPHIWMRYMGSTSNGQAPFPIWYHFSNTSWTAPDNITLSPLNISLYSCNETYANGSISACSCIDCESSCDPMPPPPAPEVPFTILGIDGYTFIMACVFLAFVIFFGSYVICLNVCNRNSLYIGSGKGRNDMTAKDAPDNECCDSYSTGGSQTNLISSVLVSPADISCAEKLGARVEAALRSGFSCWGTFCARNPLIVILIAIIVFGSLAGGIAKYDVTTDPVKLWSAPGSTARTEKDYFDSHFGPFYRTEQVIISRPENHTRVKYDYPPPSVDSLYFTSLFDKDFMHQMLNLQLDIMALEAPFEDGYVTMNDICFKPMAPDHEECTVQSVLQFYQNNATNLDKVVMDEWEIFTLADYLSHFLYCVQAPSSVSDMSKLNMSCLGDYGGPAFPWVVVGGYDEDNYSNATAFVMTFVVNNHLNEGENAKAEAWEKVFIDFMKNYQHSNMSVSYSSERSIQDELDRESKSDIWTILISYILMFVYISLALGHFRSCDTIFIDFKITLGLVGVIIVILSVAASIGFYSFLSVPMTLIIIEVVPFLVLAVGIDNIFILVQTYQRDERKKGETLEEQIGRTLGTVGPSMLLTSLSESVAFFLGSLTDMPAVRAFALYAAMAVLFDFLLQITCFISLMTIDARREEANRFDMCCCLNLPKKEKVEKSDGCLYYLVKNYYSKGLFTEGLRPIIIITFAGTFFAAIAFMFHINVGLDQALAMPKDSFVLDYFKNITAYLSVGAPVYFVVPAGINYMTTHGQDNVCGGRGCPQDSLVGQLHRAAQLDNYTYIAQPASSWIDDYFDWVSSRGDPQCCRLNATGGFCPSSSEENCTNCPFQPQVAGRPSAHDFMMYLPMFLSDNPGLKCAKGGHPAYAAGVNIIDNDTAVGASYFMTYHTPLKTSADYIHGLKEARELATKISEFMNVTKPEHEVFPYSIFYVYYEQYLSIVHFTLINISMCVAAIFVVTFVLLGFDVKSALIVVVTILMIVIDIMGMMYLWGIDLNALSLVNLVMAIGISVEFCSHIVRAFAVSIQPTRVLRAQDALDHMGSSVLSGITITKLIGVSVLVFAKSQLFQVFYFRMYLGMVIFGATHGLIFLPVLLSYVGPGVNKARLYAHQQANKSKANGTAPAVGNNTRTPDYESTSPPNYSQIKL